MRKKLILTLFTALCLVVTSFAQVSLKSESTILYEYDVKGDSMTLKQKSNGTNLIKLEKGILTITSISSEVKNTFIFKAEGEVYKREAKDAEGNVTYLLQSLIKDETGREGVLQFTIDVDGFICVDLVFDESLLHFGKLSDLTDYDEKPKNNFI
jgi:hypothetical protein